MNYANDDSASRLFVGAFKYGVIYWFGLQFLLVSHVAYFPQFVALFNHLHYTYFLFFGFGLGIFHLFLETKINAALFVDKHTKSLPTHQSTKVFKISPFIDKLFITFIIFYILSVGSMLSAMLAFFIKSHTFEITKWFLYLLFMGCVVLYCIKVFNVWAYAYKVSKDNSNAK